MIVETVADIIASPHFQAAVERVRAGYTQTVMAQSTSQEDRERALLKYHLLDELQVDLSTHIKE